MPKNQQGSRQDLQRIKIKQKKDNGENSRDKPRKIISSNNKKQRQTGGATQKLSQVKPPDSPAQVDDDIEDQYDDEGGDEDDEYALLEGFKVQHNENDRQYQQLLREDGGNMRRSTKNEELEKKLTSGVYQGAKAARRQLQTFFDGSEEQSSRKNRASDEILSNDQEESVNQSYSEAENGVYDRELGDDGPSAQIEQRASYLAENEDVQEELAEMQREDEKLRRQQFGQVEDERQRGQAVRHQLAVWRQLALLRLQLQKTVESAKRLPERDFLFTGGQQVLRNGAHVKYTQTTLLRSLEVLQSLREECLANVLRHSAQEISLPRQAGFGVQRSVLNGKARRQKFIQKQVLRLAPLIEEQLAQQEIARPATEEQIVKWSQKTRLALNSAFSKNGALANASALMQTPLGQVQKAMREYDRLLERSRLRRDALRCIGQKKLLLERKIDPLVFDDMDLYTMLLKEEIVGDDDGDNDNDKLDDQDAGEDGGKEMLSQHTRVYLLERKLRKHEENLDQKKKAVDRRASKGRKIRFVVHQKLINFMTPQDDSAFLLESRQEIINTIRGGEQGSTQAVKKSNNSEPFDVELLAQ